MEPLNPHATPERDALGAGSGFAQGMAYEAGLGASEWEAFVSLAKKRLADSMSRPLGDPGSHVIPASEADYEDGVRCVVMPCCAFTMDASHTDHGIDPPQYTCPCCAGPDV